MVYRLNDMEFALLRAFAEAPIVNGLEDITRESLSDAEKVIDDLVSKGCMIVDDDGYYTTDDLTLILKVIKEPFYSFTIDGAEKTLAAYFKEDAIVLIVKESEYTVMWIPFLPLLIGAVASFLEPFPDICENADIGCDNLCGIDEIKKKLSDANYALKWIVSYYKGFVKIDELYSEIYDSNRGRVLIEYDENGMNASIPDKAGLVNSITRIIAKFHGESINEVNWNE